MNSSKKSQNIFAHSPSLQLLWKCASQRRLVTKTLIHSAIFQNIYKDALQYVNSKNRRRSPIALILDSHLMIGLVYVYSKTVFLWHQDVEKLYKDTVVHRFLEFDDPTKSKLTRKKEAILTNTQWEIDIDENLLPDERVLLERDFSIEIPRQRTPPVSAQSPDNLPPLPWEVSKPAHGKRITLLPDIEEPIPKFDIIDDRFGEPLPIAPSTTTPMDVDERHDRTFFRTMSDDRSKELLRAPRVDRHMGVHDRYLHPSNNRTIDENQLALPLSTAKSSELPPLPIIPMDTTNFMPENTSNMTRDQFSIDAFAFLTSSVDSYPIYELMPTKTVLLGAHCILNSDIPLIVVQEPTFIMTDEIPVQMDTLPPLDQQLPNDVIMGVAGIDAQVPDVVMKSTEEKDYFHISKRKRNAPNALNKKRKDLPLYEDIVHFNYNELKDLIDREEEEFEKDQIEQKPWAIITGRNGTKRMNKLLEKAQVATYNIEIGSLIDDIDTIGKVLANPNETDDLIQIRRTGQEMAIRRGQSSGLLPKAGTRSPSSLVPTIQNRESQLPPRTSDGEILPPLLSGFDDLPIIPQTSEPLTNVQQVLSPKTSRKERTNIEKLTEPLATWQDKHKQKAIEDLLNLDGGSFNQYLKALNANRIQAARHFSVLLVLCAEGRLKVKQNQAYDEINILINEKHNQAETRTQSDSEIMDSDENQF